MYIKKTYILQKRKERNERKEKKYHDYYSESMKNKEI